MSDEIAQVQRELRQRMEQIKDELTSLEAATGPSVAERLGALKKEGLRLARIYRWLREG